MIEAPDLVIGQTMIAQLNARYALALDGLVPRPAETWADTFAPDGRMRILAADGSVLANADGRQALVDMWQGFPDIATTRHWFGSLVIEVDGVVARMRATVAAVSIAVVPAAWTRTGTYADHLVTNGSGWRFRERVLTLDPASRI